MPHPWCVPVLRQGWDTTTLNPPRSSGAESRRLHLHFSVAIQSDRIVNPPAHIVRSYAVAASISSALLSGSAVSRSARLTKCCTTTSSSQSICPSARANSSFALVTFPPNVLISNVCAILSLFNSRALSAAAFILALPRSEEDTSQLQ